ncbi:MAG: tRNA 2-selenouridine(34) synthase MnmH [Microcoleaceae cyanobacterium]
MSQPLHPKELCQPSVPILDVRSPTEYAAGHVPGAISFPLFTDQERAQVGTCYKHQGRNRAVHLGFRIVGPKCADFITQAETLAPNHRVYLYCWRGGMRSSAVGWVLEMAGFEVSVVIGGYKAFRRWGAALLKEPQKMIILGGMTGTGKTAILDELDALGSQILNLEELANHRGSSYGALGQAPQPTNEQFLNLITAQWSKLQRDQPVWIEAESKRIGTCRIPEELFQQMQTAPVVEIQKSRPERLQRLVQDYGEFSPQDLVAATERIRKRLGGARTQTAINLIQAGKLTEATDLILQYYDKAYQHDLEQRSTSHHSVDLTDCLPLESARKLQAIAQQILLW